MSADRDFAAVFSRLRSMMLPFAAALVCTKDAPGDYSLHTRHVMKNRKPLWFGAVQTRSNYVSYHLMPVYVFPDLLEGLSAGLMKRMQGKSCFNFRSVDEDLFAELGALTSAGYERYRASEYVR